MKKLLIAHSNPDMRDVLHQALFTAFGDVGPPQVVDASNKAEALIHCANVDFDLVVTSLGLAAELKSPVSHMQGTKLLRRLRERHCEMPVIVIAPAFRQEIAQETYSLGGILVCEDSVNGTLDEEIIEQARLHLQRTSEPPRNQVDIEINLAEARYRIMDKLGKMRSAFTGSLVLRKERLAELTRNLDLKARTEQPDWENSLRKLGDELTEELFDYGPNLPFRVAHARAEEQTGCRDNAVRLRFVINDREQHFYPLEAILPPEDRTEYWMLQAPLFRTVKARTTTPSLFEEPQDRRHPMNCLLINADTSGRVDSLEREFPHMNRTKDECSGVQRLLELNREPVNVGRITVLSSDDPDERNTPTWANIQRWLRTEEWHLVHYAGHSYYHEQDRKGYILLSGDIPERPDPIEARQFASAFGDIPQFVYLSSCDSSADEFVFELAKAGVPAVAGFRWAVADDSASEYALSFYQHLLREQCLEIAFWQARKEIHDQGSLQQNMIWAAAMLIIQTG